MPIQQKSCSHGHNWWANCSGTLFKWKKHVCQFLPIYAHGPCPSGTNLMAMCMNGVLPCSCCLPCSLPLSHLILSCSAERSDKWPQYITGCRSLLETNFSVSYNQWPRGGAMIKGAAGPWDCKVVVHSLVPTNQSGRTDYKWWQLLIDL